MGITIIYLQDQGSHVNITAESLGSDGKAQYLANKIIQNLLFRDDVFYSEGQDISNCPISPLIQ
jgi:hypothetical protein